MSAATGPLEGLRRPEYTGENRCIPCTVVNTVIALVLAAAVAAVVGPLAGTGIAVGAAVGGVVLLVSLAAIYLRGYLVPYTPQLTKRYLPDGVLALFDKAEPGATGVAAEAADETADKTADEADAPAEVDVEGILLSVDALRERPDGDLEVTPEFEAEWFEEVQAVEEADAGRERLAEILDVDPEDLVIEEFDRAFIASIEGVHAGRWESRAAVLADVAAARVFAERYDGWEDAHAAERSQLLSGLRLFLEECPECGSPVSFGQEVVQSCCRSAEVVAVTCEGCESRLFEMDAPSTAEAA